MKKTAIITIPALVLILLAVFAARRALRPEEAEIRRNLRRIAALLSKVEGEPPAAGFIRTQRAVEYFTEDCRIRAGGYRLTGQDELRAALQAARASASRISVRLHDMDIVITGETSAEARLTALAEADGPFGESAARELKILFSRLDGEWKIKHAETVEVLR